MDKHAAVSVGIESGSGRRPFTYAALDAERRLLALCTGDMDEVVAYCSGQVNAVVTVGAPAATNKGLLADKPISRRLTDMRVVEYELRTRGLPTPHTPCDRSACPAWMQRGFDLHQNLQNCDFKPYPAGDAPRQLIESYADAVFWALLGRDAFGGGTLESRLQRQLVLHERKLPVSNPLNFFEEVTRHRILQGILPLENILIASELNALALAYTAWLAITDPSVVACLGDPSEGVIVLPTEKLPNHYTQEHLGI
jgi:hypothetical protein